MNHVKTQPDDKVNLKHLGFIGIPFLLVVAPLLGYFFGNWLDGLFDTSPYLAYFFLLIGVAAAIRELYRLVREFIDDDKPND